ncbi:MAG: acetate--CoA ligase family protein, partial [Thaumarchaeota archaeon]|nr:acetate--CoA ligase family protein [Nitrososphaerota archaeon]
IAEDEAEKMVMSIKAHKLLEGVRGEKPSDMKSLVNAIQRLSQMVIDMPEIQEIDINPLVVFTAGKGCKALDARISLQ